MRDDQAQKHCQIEEAMYEAVINGNDNHLIKLVNKGVRKI
jgi:hypothetical protein